MSVEAAQALAAGNFANGENVLWTADPSIELPLKIAPDGPGSEKPVTCVQAFKRAVQQSGSKTALRVNRGGKWVEWTWSQYYADSFSFGKGAIAAGLEPHNCVSIIGFNSPEWLISDMGSILAGGVPAGIYTTNGPDACFYIADHSKSVLAVVENETHLQKFLEIRDNLPHLKAIVMWEGEVPAGTTGAVYDWASFMALGASVDDAVLEARMAAQSAGQCATLIYTSGTTGNPKAVMLSHDNLTWTSHTANELFKLGAEDQIVSYLPLSHIAAQMLDIHGPMTTMSTVSFAQPDALQGSLVTTLQDVRPTMFMGVPRVWEKIEETMRAVGAANSGVKKSIGDWAKAIGLKGNYAKVAGDELPWGWTIAKTVIFSAIRKQLGLDRCRMQATGAAPISKQTLEYLMSVDVPVYDLYGMSESSGPQNVSVPGAWKIGSCGKSVPGTELCISQPDAKGEGELIYRGRHIFMGYMHNPEATASTIDDQGFLHSGDIGKVDDDGFMSITGRLKELIITAGGENIPPVLIEDLLKEELPAVSNVMVIGDQRKFLSCVLTLRCEVDAEAKPTNKLAAPALAAGQAAGSAATTVQEAAECSKFVAMIQAGVDQYNKRSVSRAQHVQKFYVVREEFSVDGGELTPTMKLKRKIVNEKYSSQIEAMYGGEVAIKASL